MKWNGNAIEFRIEKITRSWENLLTHEYLFRYVVFRTKHKKKTAK